MGVDEPRMDRDDRPARSNNNPAVENAAEARKAGGRAKMKRIGMVEGMKAVGHAGRKPRKAGGRAEGGPARAPERKSMFEDVKPRYLQDKPELSSSRRDRAAALLGYNGSEDASSPGSPPPKPYERASPGEGAMTGSGQARAQPSPVPRPRPSVAAKSGPTPGELEADRLMAKYNAPAERSASAGEGAKPGTDPARAEPEERMKSYNTASDLGLKRGGTARKARASGGRTGSNNAPLSSAHMGDRPPTASKEIG